MTQEVLARIKKRRETLGLSQENMAEGLEINQSTYSKIESGVTKLSVALLERIGKVLGVSINELLTQDGTERVSSEILDELLAQEERVEYLTTQNRVLTQALSEEQSNKKLVESKDRLITELKLTLEKLKKENEELKKKKVD